MIASLVITVSLLAHRPDTLPSARVQAVRTVVPATESVKGERLNRQLSLPDAIRDFSGIQLRDYGGVGGLKTINVRSLGSAHTAIFLDGLPIDNAQNMQVDLGRIGTRQLESVELYQGQRSRLLQTAREFGSASSLHLTSALPSPGRVIHLHLHGGAFGTVAPEMRWERGWNSRFRSRVLLGGSTAHGHYSFHVKDRGYDKVMTRENCDLTEARALVQLFYQPAGGYYQLSVNAYDSHRGIPGPVYKQADAYSLSEDRQNDRSLSVHLSGEQTLSRRLQMLLRAQYVRDRLSYLDVSEQDPSVSAFWNYLQQSAYVSAALDWEVLTWLHLGGALDGQLDILEAQVPARRKTLYAALSASLLKDPLRASLSLQWQGSTGAGRYSFLSPAFLLNWHLSPNWEFGAMAKRSCRLPSFNDLYYTSVPPKGLKPESVWQTAIHLRWRQSFGRWYFTARTELYYNWVQDKLIAVPNGSLFRWSMYNLEGVRIFGDELMVSAAYETSHWAVGGTARYTFQWARDVATMGQIPYIPLHSANFQLFASWRGFRVEVQGFVSGERFSSSTNRADFRIAPWNLWDANLTWQMSRLRLGLQLKNLFNESYEIIRQYPMPGFHVLASLDYSF